MSETWTVVLTVVTVLGTLALSVGGGAWFTPLVLRAASRSTTREARALGAGDPEGDPGTPAGPQAVAALRGGTWIGLLERFAVTGCLLAGYPAGIALVVAVKGLGRYPELREKPVASERFVVGTLASLVWSALVGVGGVWVLGLLR
ncbi:hypothetical protein GCM10025865_29780 [Paraoerskovia sediminicola]|uniref:DUF4190 domain-containing protein n=1 Tax=Paraoerskovia sediminicola TaxID=1138587 RepID=A0ABM8G6D6_9CELL|nr:hypothetical protein [Paraoerskovia sediminicola]BDZ43679.1 hypothetical protein GCM10025865_29780 [Paraoerskovia sediminicola]